jgi:hypothetical protein
MGLTPASRRASLLVGMAVAARDAGVVPGRIHLVVAIDRLLVWLLEAAPGLWVVKGGYAIQLRRPNDARFTDDLTFRIDAAIETAPELLASGFGATHEWTRRRAADTGQLTASPATIRTRPTRTGQSSPSTMRRRRWD